MSWKHQARNQGRHVTLIEHEMVSVELSLWMLQEMFNVQPSHITRTLWKLYMKWKIRGGQRIRRRAQSFPQQMVGLKYQAVTLLTMVEADSAQTDALTLFKPRKLSPALVSSGRSQLSLHNQVLRPVPLPFHSPPLVGTFLTFHENPLPRS